jgi:hypothetical protein
MRVMIQSYTQTPAFGDPKKFQAEIDSVILKVQKLESELHSHSILLDSVNYELEQKHGIHKSPLMAPQLVHEIELDSPEGRRSSSAGYGTISNYSNSDQDRDSLENSDINIGTAVALYPYAGDCSESSIAMEAGEEFIVTEGDEGGWTKVRRKNINSEGFEGFVPTTYLQWI